MLLNVMNLDYDYNMAFTSYLILSHSHLKKKTIHECDFVDTDSCMHWLTHHLFSQKLNSEECNDKTLSQPEEIIENSLGGWLVTLKDKYEKPSDRVGSGNQLWLAQSGIHRLQECVISRSW